MSHLDKKILLATDNKDLLDRLCEKFPNIISTGSLDNINGGEYRSLHFTSRNESDNLWNAVADLIIIANATDIKTTFDFGGKSGFSSFICQLNKNKKILEELLS
jgi:hypothetical protein